MEECRDDSAARERRLPAQRTGLRHRLADGPRDPAEVMLQLLGSVGEGGGGDRLALPHLGAGGGALPGADLLQHLMASRIGQGLRDQVNLVLGKSFLFRHGCLRMVRRRRGGTPTICIGFAPRAKKAIAGLGLGPNLSSSPEIVDLGSRNNCENFVDGCENFAGSGNMGSYGGDLTLQVLQCLVGVIDLGSEFLKENSVCF